MSSFNSSFGHSGIHCASSADAATSGGSVTRVRFTAEHPPVLTRRPSRADGKTMANAIRALAMDAVQKAKSGHPGAPMGMADMAVALWDRHLRHNPANPHWPDRDRFVLSNGHASMLLYALLHLTGYNLPIDELKRFRQLHSRTAGHPEVGVTPGVETTTGPLGQGLANAVGMALAEKLMADEFNRPGHTVVDHRTYTFLGDGCLMEGISHEACSLAGALGLGKLVALYDDNGISIDGKVTPWFNDDTPARFRAYGWEVIGPLDGQDVDAVDAALIAARADSTKPTLIVCRTAIGAGSPNRAGSAKAHGEPLGDEEIRLTREAIGWPHPPFEIPADIRAAWDAKEHGRIAEADWQARFTLYEAAHPQLGGEFRRRMAGKLPENFREVAFNLLAQSARSDAAVATRKASQIALATLAPAVPELLGGSADLTGSVLTDFPGCGAVRKGEPGGRHISYGVREFAMAAIMNGITLHGGFIPYAGTFLAFADYSRNAIRMAALMKQRVIHIFTHDSIGLGEDGPTHQPVEHALALRAIPNLDVWRPCDQAETSGAWITAISQSDRPSALLLSRQALPACQRTPEQVIDIARGGYVLSEAPATLDDAASDSASDAAGASRPRDAKPDAIVIATGSEVKLALEAQVRLAAVGIAVRVVSMPSTSVFERQSLEWRRSVLPNGVPKLAVEAGVTLGWWRYVGSDGAVIGLDRFGDSAPAEALFIEFGITAEAVVAGVKALVHGGADEELIA